MHLNLFTKKSSIYHKLCTPKRVVSTIRGAYHFIWCTPRILVDTKNSAHRQDAPRAGHRNVTTKDINTREGPTTFLKVIINIKLL